MKRNTKLNAALLFAAFVMISLFCACSAPEIRKADVLEANINLYSRVWDDIMNKGKLEMFNDSNFVKDVVMHASPADVVGIDSMKAFYANYLTGFSKIEFTIKDIFGQGDKLVKHWNFRGTHSGEFFGIPATGKAVSLEGVTLVKMSGGKIAEEQNFFDNLDFLTQLGLMPPAGQ